MNPTEPMEITRHLIQRLEQQRRGPRLLIGICGRAGAGKTTLASVIASELGMQGYGVVRYSCDWRFIRDSAARKRWLAEQWQVGIEAYLHALDQRVWWDFTAVASDLAALLAGRSLRLQGVYDRRTGKNELTIDLPAQPAASIICYEGCILGGVELLEQIDAFVVLNTPDELCLTRLLERDRGRRTVPEIAARLLVTSHSENRFFELLHEHFAPRLLPCDGAGRIGGFPRFDAVEQLPLPIPTGRSRPRGSGVVLIDLDGVIIRHGGDTLLPGSVERLRELQAAGMALVLVSSRPFSQVVGWAERLRTAGVAIDRLLADLPLGTRHLIIDQRPGAAPAAAIQLLPRDSGLAAWVLDRCEPKDPGSPAR